MLPSVLIREVFFTINVNHYRNSWLLKVQRKEENWVSAINGTLMPLPLRLRKYCRRRDPKNVRDRR